jgi:hypothetical protein
MASISMAEIARHDPDTILPPDPALARQYWDRVDFGRREAKSMRVAMVAICRNAMPWLPLTMSRVEQTGLMFKDWKCFIYENDSTDGTQDYLAEAARRSKRVFVSLNSNRRPHLNFTKAAERTIALAEYRNECRNWVRRNAQDCDYTIVFDTDPWGGWSIHGVANTLGWLEDYENDLDDGDGWFQDWGQAAGMASYSWCKWRMPQFGGEVIEAHYDAWACRWNHWNERSELWFHLWHPPVGGEPVRMNSAFGQLGVYRTRRFLEGVYRGGDCEHVSHWRTCGGDCFLNPSQRVVSFWAPSSDDEQETTADGLREDLREDVAGGNANPSDSGNAEDIG